MSDNQSNNKRIAKNAVMLYLRMFLTMIVGLYTSRVILQTLGAEDFGIYGVVGGIVAMLGFLNASLSGATSRFLTYELGKGNDERIAKTFSSALISHFIIALIVLVLAETVGLWFLCNKLVILENRMYAAHWVYQLSIFSAMLSITQVPYNSCIIAHEKMDVYAYVEILNVTLKLVIVYLLVIGNFDKLILYAVLTLIVSIIVLFIYRIYCLRQFRECKFHFVWDKNYLKPLMSFTGWNIYTALCVTGRQQGNNFILNIFGGAILNAAASLAITVDGIVSGFAYNIVTAFRPPIIKLYASNEYNGLAKMLQLATLTSLVLFSLVMVPLVCESEYILGLWLGNVPKHTSAFMRVILISSTFSIFNTVLVAVIHATGNIKLNSILTGTISLLSLVPLYILLESGISVDIAYAVVIASNMLISIINIVNIRQQVSSLSLSFVVKDVLYLCTLFVVLYASSLLFTTKQSFMYLIINFFSNAILQLIFYISLLSKAQRRDVWNMCRKVVLLYKK